MDAISKIEAVNYKMENGVEPYYQWYMEQDDVLKNKIDARIVRIKAGLLGQINNVGEGVHEFKDKETAFRLYFGNDGKKLIILLLGGKKTRQQNDIEKAKGFWKDYKRQKKEKNNGT